MKWFRKKRQRWCSNGDHDLRFFKKEADGTLRSVLWAEASAYDYTLLPGYVSGCTRCDFGEDGDALEATRQEKRQAEVLRAKAAALKTMKRFRDRSGEVSICDSGS